MDREPEELQHLGALGIYATAVHLIRLRRDIFVRIFAAFVIPLSVLFLAHVHISHVLFARLDSDDAALDSSSPAAQPKLLKRLADDWAALLIFKACYLVLLLVLSLLSTAAVVFSVASLVSSKDGLSFGRVLSVVPKVWRRLMQTFLAAFILLAGYNSLFLAVSLIVLFMADDGPLAAPLLVLIVIAYIVGLVAVSVVWHLASVVSVLEEVKGFDAMRKARALIKGKIWVAAAIFVKLTLCFVLVEVLFRHLVSRSHVGFGGKVVYGALLTVVLGVVVMFALVVQTVVYFVCKAYHHENIDKSSLSDHLEVYLGEYVPLTAKDVQLEQFSV